MKSFSIESINKEIHRLQTIKAVILRSKLDPKDDITTYVFKLYLELCSTKEVADKLNNHAFSTSDKNVIKQKFTSSNVSQMIQHGTVSDKDLEFIVKSMFEDHKNFMLHLT